MNTKQLKTAKTKIDYAAMNTKQPKQKEDTAL